MQSEGGVLGYGTRGFNPCKGILARSWYRSLGLWVANCFNGLYFL